LRDLIFFCLCFLFFLLLLASCVFVDEDVVCMRRLPLRPVLQSSRVFCDQNVWCRQPFFSPTKDPKKSKKIWKSALLFFEIVNWAASWLCVCACALCVFALCVCVCVFACVWLCVRGNSYLLTLTTRFVAMSSPRKQSYESWFEKKSASLQFHIVNSITRFWQILRELKWICLGRQYSQKTAQYWIYYIKSLEC